MTDSYRYNSYGELEETQGETENPYLYTGEYFDEGTGLYYLRARYMNPETGTFTSMDTYRGNAYDPASLHRYTYAQNNPQMYNDPSGHFVGLIGAATNLACAQMIRTTCVTNMAGTLTGFVNGIISEMLGGEEDTGAAFVKGFLFGAGAIVGIAAAYTGAAAIKTLHVISDAVDILSLAREVKECVKSIVLAIVFVVTGCRTQAAIYVSFAAIYFTNILVTLGLSGIVRAKGPNGSVDIGVKGGSNSDNYVYRALNQKDYERYTNGLGLEAKNPNGNWSLNDHLVNGSGKASWANDPYISTTSDLSVAKGFNQSGSGYGIVKIDMNKVTSASYKGYEIYPRVNGVEGLPYHYSVWQQETSVYQSIPFEAIVGYFN